MKQPKMRSRMGGARIREAPCGLTFFGTSDKAAAFYLSYGSLTALWIGESNAARIFFSDHGEGVCVCRRATQQPNGAWFSD